MRNPEGMVLLTVKESRPLTRRPRTCLTTLRESSLCMRLGCAIWMMICTTCCFSQSPAPSDGPKSEKGFGFGQVDLAGLNQHQFDFEDTPTQLQPLLVQLIMEAVPHDYENTIQARIEPVQSNDHDSIDS